MPAPPNVASAAIKALPELGIPPQPVASDALHQGWQARLPVSSLSRQEIIEMALIMDPFPIHTDPAFGAQSRFGDIIASGMHPYLHYHKSIWVPLVKAHFISGISWDGVVFYQPVLPEETFYGVYTVAEYHPKPHKQAVVIIWFMDLYRACDDVHMQRAKWTVYHTYPANPS